MALTSRDPDAMNDANRPPRAERQPLETSHIEDLKLAASKMGLVERRSFQAAMAEKYCSGGARLAELVFGWNRDAVELGLREKQSGVTCLGAHKVYGGNKLWEEKHPAVAEALWALAEAHAQQNPTFQNRLAYTRLTAAEALNQLRAQGFPPEVLPSPSAMAVVLNRNGYRLRPVVKAKPQKKSLKPTPSSPTSSKSISQIPRQVKSSG